MAGRARDSGLPAPPRVMVARAKVVSVEFNIILGPLEDLSLMSLGEWDLMVAVSEK